MRTWYAGKWLDIQVGQEATVFRFGQSLALGEAAVLREITKKHLIFVTDSGAEVRTQANNIHMITGRAKDCGYCVALRNISDFPHITRAEVRL